MSEWLSEIKAGEVVIVERSNPGDFAVAAEIIAERLEGLARAYRAQAEEWKKR